MAEQTSDKPAPRGDAAYRAQKDAITARNDAARKAGKEFRQAEDQKAIRKRADGDKADMDGLRNTFGGNTSH
jgi:hypothetical protein